MKDHLDNMALLFKLKSRVQYAGLLKGKKADIQLLSINRMLTNTITCKLSMGRDKYADYYFTFDLDKTVIVDELADEFTLGNFYKYLLRRINGEETTTIKRKSIELQTNDGK